ncbi:DUF4222 domain-containing protein [Escherichia coli]|uniref:DUF4222 domain-containing protein n=1 Tax=Escherichia sp. 79.0191 TaxID=2730947 RepID=UPI000E7515FF|nr:MULTISPECIES: DUF4222 domain-containing protein [Escherichia]EAC1461714.1 DUF4222 domain-containing protein [Escherichia coli]EAC1718035.1 DUF4222 domain-containing protein [Escherichia coli]EEW1807764.1 DUF4222 domain-containing protein [Escherichia coli]EEW1879638.1 DUF4222 domain-containing protein [Escherichia coli]EEW2016351.1 DUF4222 domain-containing protein [Escherichia coli]
MKEGVGIFSKNRKLTKHIRRLRLLIQRYKDDHGAFVTVTSVEETRVVFMRDGYPHYCLISLALTISFHENILLINGSSLVATKCRH